MIVNLTYFSVFAAEGDSFTSEFYANPVAIGDFEKHCIQRRKYPVLLQIEFNNATRENDAQVSIFGVFLPFWLSFGNFRRFWISNSVQKWPKLVRSLHENK